MEYRSRLQQSSGRCRLKSLQNRIGRKRVTAAMREQTPVVLHGLRSAVPRRLAAAWKSRSPVRRALLEEVFAVQSAHNRGEQHAGEKRTRPRIRERFSLSPRLRRKSSETAFARLILASIERPVEARSNWRQAYVDARGGAGNEGVMLKAAASLYQPGRRGLAWLKLKRELATLDVVVTSAEYGHGKRAGNPERLYLLPWRGPGTR